MMRSKFRCVLSVGLMLGTLAVARTTAGAATTPDLQASARSQSARGASGAPARSPTFEIYQDRSNEHRWRLKASNGQIIASSGQGYKDKRDCRNAIDRIKKDAATKLKVETYEDNAQQHRGRLRATDAQIIAATGTGREDKRDCPHAADG